MLNEFLDFVTNDLSDSLAVITGVNDTGEVAVGITPLIKTALGRAGTLKISNNVHYFVHQI
uniref:hypothetical protein n=1 Tax=Psychrobacter sp. DAB_AL62B TaxID=1028420 RepID=UPI00025718D3|nr:hypothetical protein [Psychrobacter sp. DAB_AL62B]AFD62179.1 hypothetical protein [Psychrobacter sp. DAB_AL62B]